MSKFAISIIPFLFRVYWFDFGGGVVPSAFLLLNPNYMPYPPHIYNDFDKYDEPRLHMEKLMSAHLIEFDISLRILYPLESAGITRLGELVKMSKKDLLKINQLGKTSVDKIQKFLEYYGLSLAK